MTTFFPEGRATRDPYLRSASLSSAFEHWQRKYHQHPIWVPDELRRRVPVPTPLEHLTPKLEQTANDPAHVYMCECCKHALEKVNHPQVGHFERAKIAHPHAHERPNAPRLEHSDHEVDIDFDIDTSITTVSIWSFFVGVTKEQARTLVAMADPPQWRRAVPAFFEGSEPGLLNEATGKFQRDRRAAELRKYQLEEYVEWHWSPQVEGGMVNVLEIERPSRVPTSASDLVRDVLVRTDAKQPFRSDLGRAAADTAPELLDEYDYRLVRSVQSKFVSTWETGGIDVDQGSYAAAWLAPAPQRRNGALFVYSRKALRYSQRADVIPGMKTMLNLLAPAVVSMLMTHLGYSGIVDFLTRSPDDEAGHAAA